MTKTCIVIGGGLAGLVAARQLALAGWQVSLFEKESYLGGKAAAVDRGAPVPIEHGYHVFPRWYENVRGLLDEINGELSASEAIQLKDLDGYHYLKPRASSSGTAHGEFIKVYSPSGRKALMDNTRRGIMPWYFQYLYMLSVVDLLSESLSRRSLLDRISQIGFIRSRFYKNENLAKLNQENMLKGSAIPAYEMSSMTAKKVADYWVGQPDPFLSVLPGDLQGHFIDPIAESAMRVKNLDGSPRVKMHLHSEVTALTVDHPPSSAPRVGSIRVRHEDGSESEESAATYILTTPVEVTRRLIREDVYRGDPKLGNIEHIESEPMSALHVFTTQTPEEMGLKAGGITRKEHVFMTGSHYGLSLIDNSDWPQMQAPQNQGLTYLSFIASNFSPLRHVDPGVAKQLLLEEVSEYLNLDRSQIQQSFMNPNTEVPLYINTVGSWPQRPRVTSAIENLFIAGDYVQNAVDLACMEGAVASAIDASHELTKRYEENLNPSSSPASAYTRWQRKAKRMATMLSEPLPQPTKLQPRRGQPGSWTYRLDPIARRLHAVVKDKGPFPSGVTPPSKEPFAWPRRLYSALFAGLLMGPAGVAVALAKLDSRCGRTRLPVSSIKEAANQGPTRASGEGN